MLIVTELKINNKNKYSNKLIPYHQNIFSLDKKRAELNIMQPNLISPHLV
jgi:hypothetical protein